MHSLIATKECWGKVFLHSWGCVLGFENGAIYLSIEAGRAISSISKIMGQVKGPISNAPGKAILTMLLGFWLFEPKLLGRAPGLKALYLPMLQGRIIPLLQGFWLFEPKLLGRALGLKAMDLPMFLGGLPLILRRVSPGQVPLRIRRGTSILLG